MRENLQEMLNRLSEKLEGLQAANVDLSRRCNSTNTSRQFTERGFLQVSKSLTKRWKSLRVMRAKWRELALKDYLLSNLKVDMASLDLAL